MLYQLLKYDLAWRSAIRLSMFAAAAGLALAAWGRMDAMKVALLVGAMALTTPVMFASPDIRAGVATMALPLTGRQIFAQRVVSILALIWLPFLALLAGLLPAGGVDADSISAAFMALSAITAVSCYLLTRHLDEAKAFRRDAPQSTVAIVATVVMAMGVATVTAAALSQRDIPLRYSAPAGALALLFAAWRLASAWPRTPLVFQLVAIPKSGEESSKPYERAARPWWLYVRLVCRWTDVMLLPYVLLLCVSPEWSLLAFGGVAATCQMMLRGVQALPLDPRKAVVGRLAIAASIVALVTGAWLFAPGTRITGMPAPHTTAAQEENSRQGQIITPLAYWRLADTARPPVVESPWGERAYPPVQRFLGVSVYNPYFAANQSSSRFFDWQWSRATAAFCGATQPRAIGTTRHPWRNAMVSARLRLLSVAEILFAGACVYWLSAWQLWFRVNRRLLGVKRAVSILQVVVTFLFGFAPIALRMSNVGFGKDSSSVFASLMQLAAVHWDAGFANPAALAAATLALLAIPSFFIWRQARELEVQNLPQAARQR